MINIKQLSDEQLTTLETVVRRRTGLDVVPRKALLMKIKEERAVREEIWSEAHAAMDTHIKNLEREIMGSLIIA